MNHADLTELVQRGVPQFDLSDKQRRILQIDASAQNDVEQVKRALDKLVTPGAVHFALIASYLSEAIHKSGISHNGFAHLFGSTIRRSGRF